MMGALAQGSQSLRACFAPPYPPVGTLRFPTPLSIRHVDVKGVIHRDVIERNKHVGLSGKEYLHERGVWVVPTGSKRRIGSL